MQRDVFAASAQPDGVADARQMIGEPARKAEVVVVERRQVVRRDSLCAGVALLANCRAGWHLQHLPATASMEGGGEAAWRAIVDNSEHPIGIVLADE